MNAGPGEDVNFHLELTPQQHEHSIRAIRLDEEEPGPDAIS